MPVVLYKWPWDLLIKAYGMWCKHVCDNGSPETFTVTIEGVRFDTTSGFGSSELCDRYANHVLDIFVVFLCLRVAKVKMKDAGHPQTYENKVKYTSEEIAQSRYASGFSRSKHALEYLVGKLEAALADYRCEKIGSILVRHPDIASDRNVRPRLNNGVGAHPGPSVASTSTSA